MQNRRERKSDAVKVLQKTRPKRELLRNALQRLDKLPISRVVRKDARRNLYKMTKYLSDKSHEWHDEVMETKMRMEGSQILGELYQCVW